MKQGEEEFTIQSVKCELSEMQEERMRGVQKQGMACES